MACHFFYTVKHLPSYNIVSKLYFFFRYFHLPWLDVKATSTPDTPVPRKTRHSLAQTQILSKSCLSVLLQSNQDSLFLHSPPFLPPQNKQLISIECLRSLVRFFVINISMDTPSWTQCILKTFIGQYPMPTESSH